MKTVQVIIILFLLFVTCNYNGLYADDSIPSTDLQELVVKSDRIWIENGVINIIPTKKEKQLSNSPGRLIDMMNIPFLIGEGESIKTLSDQPVSIFINGEPANEIDLSTFWPSDVKKVEYMESPSDPRFRGARNVVNFVMAKYVVGGVTRAYARQNFPMTNGYYDLASKLSYKRMTYGISVNSWSIMNKNSHGTGETIYKDIFYNGIKYDEIREESISDFDSEDWNTTIAANAKYTTDKFSATHTIGFNWRHDPGSPWNSSSVWSENLFGSEFSEGFKKSDSYSPSIRGDYFGVLSDRFTLSGSWSYIHGDNSRFSSSTFGETPAVVNDFSEKVNSLPVRVNLSYIPNSKLTFMLNVDAKSQWFRSYYAGSVNTSSKQFREDLRTSVGVYWRLSKNLSCDITPGFLYCYYNVDDIVNNYITPTCTFNVRWYPSKKVNVSGDLYFFESPISAGKSNPVIYKKDELTWVSGNPDLKPSSDWYACVEASYFPFEWLQLSSIFSCEFYRNMIYKYMEAAPEDMGGIIEFQRNSKNTKEFNVNPRVSIKLFKRKFSMVFYPKICYTKTNEGYFRSHTYFQPLISMRYIIGNFSLEAQYRGRRKYIVDHVGYQMDRQPDAFNFGVSYGQGNLYVYCGVGDIFHKDYELERSTYSATGVYTSNTKSWTPGRCVGFNLTYTFGYGKKVDQDININSGGSADSSIM
ncbi:MAG: hypothetical protein K2N05_10480 [Muribaculaceae bacterium]|nr:hypothetical protein [Muribaculaceae bacterium]